MQYFIVAFIKKNKHRGRYWHLVAAKDPHDAATQIAAVFQHSWKAMPHKRPTEFQVYALKAPTEFRADVEHLQLDTEVDEDSDAVMHVFEDLLGEMTRVTL